MIRLTFYAAVGGCVVQARARNFRLCADATLRGHDNSLAATRVDDCWLIGQQLFRHFDCAGPVLLRVRRRASDQPVSMGPFRSVRASAGRIWGDDESLDVRVPGWWAGSDSIHEVSLLDAAFEPTKPKELVP